LYPPWGQLQRLHKPARHNNRLPNKRLHRLAKTKTTRNNNRTNTNNIKYTKSRDKKRNRKILEEVKLGLDSDTLKTEKMFYTYFYFSLKFDTHTISSKTT